MDAMFQCDCWQADFEISFAERRAVLMSYYHCVARMPLRNGPRISTLISLLPSVAVPNAKDTHADSETYRNASLQASLSFRRNNENEIRLLKALCTASV